MSIRLGALLLDVTPLRVSRDFRFLYAARLTSLLGIGVLSVAASLQVYALTASSLLVGLVALAVGAPMMIGLVVGGVLADHGDQRRLMLYSRSAFVLVALVFLGNALRPEPGVGPIFAAAILSGIVNGISGPPLMAAIPALVGRQHLLAAGALTTIAAQFGAVLGPALAGVLVGRGGYVACYAVVVAAAIATPVLLSRLRPLPAAPAAQGSALTRLAEGWRFVRSDRVIRGLMLVDIAATVFAMPQALFPQLGAERFGGGPEVVGLLYMAPALGAFVGAVTSGWTRALIAPGRVVFAAVGVWSSAMLVFGVTSHLATALVLLAVAGAGDTISEILRRGLMQHHTPDHLQGRVGSVWLMQVILAPAIGNAQAGAVARLASATVAIVGGAAVSLAATAALFRRSGAVRAAAMGPAPGGRTKDQG